MRGGTTPRAKQSVFLRLERCGTRGTKAGGLSLYSPVAMVEDARARDADDIASMLRRLDHKVRLVAIAAAILGLGTAAFYFGVPLVWNERVPLLVCMIPPSIFATLTLAMALANTMQVRTARRLLAEGEIVNAQAWAWTVFAFEGPPDLHDPRRWSLPAQAAGVPHDIELDLLDAHRGWMPRQTRTVSVRLADGTRLEIRDIPAHIGAADLRAATVRRLATARGRVHGIAVRGVGLFLASTPS